MKISEPDSVKSAKHCLPKAFFISVITVILIISAGCITTDDIIKTESVEIPDDLRDGIDGVYNDLILLDSSVYDDIEILSNKIKSDETFSDRNKEILEYYLDNTWIDTIIYYDAQSDLFYSCPVILNSAEVIGSIPYPSEKELRTAKNNIIEKTCIFIPEHGYMNMLCKGVFDENGNYRGYFIILSDLYVQFNLHPFIMGSDKLYGEYVVFIVNSDNEIIYSSRQESIGQFVTDDNPFYNGEVLIKKAKSDSGAYKYSSSAFYSNMEDVETEKITAWKTVGDNRKYTIYAVKELNRPDIKQTESFELNTENTTRDVMNLYKFDDWNGIQKAIERVNSGYYSTDISIIDMTGKVAASPNPELIGLNFMNNRGSYGYSYIASMIDTVKQGGGYVYYTLPIDGTVDTPAAEYCIGYVLPLDDNYFVLGRFAGDTDLVLKNYNLRSDITTLSRNIVKEAYYDGIDSVIDKINNNREAGASVFVDGLKSNISEMSIVGFDGVVFASMNNPDNVNEISTGYKDVYGGSTTRKAIILAKNGGGLMANLIPNPEKDGYVDLWLVSIAPINNIYYSYVGSVIKTFKDDLSQYLV